MNLLINERKNHIKIQKSVIFLKNSLKDKYVKDRKITILEIIFIIQESVEVLHIAHII